MNDQTPDPALPPVGDRKTWQEARDALFAREKAHTSPGYLTADLEIARAQGPILYAASKLTAQRGYR